MGEMGPSEKKMNTRKLGNEGNFSGSGPAKHQALHPSKSHHKTGVEAWGIRSPNMTCDLR